jgi:hypothetical protein
MCPLTGIRACALNRMINILIAVDVVVQSLSLVGAAATFARIDTKSADTRLLVQVVELVRQVCCCCATLLGARATLER